MIIKIFFTTFSSSEPFPERLVDSIIVNTEKQLSKKLGYKVNVIYFKNKKGKELKTIPLNGEIGGLPATSFKKIIKQHSDKEYYIKIFATLYSSGGIKFNFGDDKYSWMKPRFTMKIVVTDKNKKTILKKTINLKDLTTVRSHEQKITQFNKDFKYKETKGLSPFDLYTIYIMGLEKLVLEL